MDTNHYHDAVGPGFDSGVNAETLSGAVRLQRIRNDFGIVECFAPSSLAGEVVSEDSYYFEGYDSEDRQYCRGRRSLRLDKARLRDFYDMEGTTLEDAEAAVTYYLMSRGYEEES